MYVYVHIHTYIFGTTTLAPAIAPHFCHCKWLLITPWALCKTPSKRKSCANFLLKRVLPECASFHTHPFTQLALLCGVATQVRIAQANLNFKISTLTACTSAKTNSTIYVASLSPLFFSTELTRAYLICCRFTRPIKGMTYLEKGLEKVVRRTQENV